MAFGALIVHFVIKARKLVEMTGTIYRIQGLKVIIVNPRWPPKIQDGRHEIQFFDIFASFILESDNFQITKNVHGNLLDL